MQRNATLRNAHESVANHNNIGIWYPDVDDSVKHRQQFTQNKNNLQTVSINKTRDKLTS